MQTRMLVAPLVATWLAAVQPSGASSDLPDVWGWATAQEEGAGARGKVSPDTIPPEPSKMTAIRKQVHARIDG